MDIRSTLFNTAREATWEMSEQYGNDLYQVSSHNGARPLCYPWQGKVISRTDSVRTVKDLDGNDILVIAQSATSYGQAAGLFGVNCRHYPMTFIPGFSDIKGQPQDPEENAQAYEESQQQRRLERRLRQEKRDLEILKAQGAPKDEIDAQKARVSRASSDIDTFCDETDRARRRGCEGAGTVASWPKIGTDTVFPTEQKERMQEFFQGASVEQSKPIRGLSSGGDNSDVPDHPPPEFVRHVLDDEDRNVVLSQYEETIRNAPVEHAYVITKDGRLYHCIGTKNRVFPDDLGDDLIGADVTHNHTDIPENEHTFSDDDIRLFLKYKLRTLRGIEALFTYQASRDDLRVDDEPIDWANEMNYRHTKIIEQAHAFRFGYRRWQYEKNRG